MIEVGTGGIRRLPRGRSWRLLDSGIVRLVAAGQGGTAYFCSGGMTQRAAEPGLGALIPRAERGRISFFEV